MTPEVLTRGGRDLVTWLGHATILVQLGEFRVLTDPNWFHPPGVPRLHPAPVELERLHDINAVLITHNHYDHLDRRTLGALPKSTLFVVPLGLATWFRRRGLSRVIELDWGDAVELEQGRVTMVPSIHWSRRWANDENRTLWGGFVVEGSHRCVYTAGDTARGEHFGAIGDAFELDVAALPIGAYLPRNIMSRQHIDPGEALDAFEQCGARRLLPIHWGTFALGDEGATEAPNELERLARERGLEGRVEVVPVGGTLWFDS